MVRKRAGAPAWCLAVLATVSANAARQEAPPRPARPPDVNFIPTRQVVADQMLRLAGVGAGDVVYDLGSGDGRILVLAAQKYDARGVGIELDPGLVALSRQIAREGEVDDRLTFQQGDIFDADISGATVVTLYLSTSINTRLEPRLRHLPPGTRIVSHQFGMGRWRPDRTVRGADGTDLHLWIVPERDAGVSELAVVLARAGLDGPVAMSCQVETGVDPAGFFAVALSPAGRSDGRYLAIAPDGVVIELAPYAGVPDLSCFTRADAERLNGSIARSATLHGSVRPRWNATVVCGVVDGAASVCWQYSPEERTFVKIGEWIADGRAGRDGASASQGRPL
ncbi:MAG: methyltransferase domain-containing protein [Acidobacteria bacterium]|nr:methyltransferase domain-containing protein [Acidobacteriota bacterium]